MLRIGLTGGIGSGKSTASRVFAALGIPVYDSDSRAKALMGSDPALMDEIRREFGAQAYGAEGLDRQYLASKVFSDKHALARLNGIVHPALGRDFAAWADGYAAAGEVPYVVMEAAILFEGGFDAGVDYSVTVSAPLEERVARAVLRDGSEPEQVRARVGNQMDDAERESRSDYVLGNADGELLLPQIIELHARLLELANK